jgi:hypothetical protein
VSPLADLSSALRGWTDVLAGKPEAAAQFRTDFSGIATAALTLVVAVLLSVAVQSAGAGLPSLLQFVFGLIALGLTIAVLAIAMQRTLKLLRTDVPLATLLVPTLYALALAFVVAIPLLAIGPNAGLIIIAGLGLAIWRLATVVSGLKVLHSIVFSAVCVIVLVVVPYALYMLLLLVPSA